MPYMSNSSTTRAHFAVLIANAIYGINFTVAKWVMPNYIKPYGFIFLRVSGALILFSIVSIFLKKEKIDKEDYWRFALCGVFGVSINQLLFFGGLNITTPINAAIIMIMTPILVMLLGSFMLKEKLHYFKVIGLTFGATGAGLIILGSSSGISFNSNTALGDLMILINATSYALYMILVKPLMKKYSTFFVITRVFLVGFIIVIPFGWREATEIQWHTFTPQIVGATLFVIIGTTFFAYLLNTYGLSKVSPSIVSFYIYLQPFLAAIFAIYFGTDTLKPLKIFAALLIFLGIYLVNKPLKNKV